MWVKANTPTRGSVLSIRDPSQYATAPHLVEMGSECIDGYCRYRCNTDPECQLIDARIGFCGRDMVCRNASEARPQCTSPGQCGDTQQCIDNVCR